MLTDEEKKFFITTARSASALSNCSKPNGAVLTCGGRMLSYGFNRRIVKNRDWEISAIYDAIFKARDMDISNSWLFSTYYPTFDDMKLIIAVGVTTVSFLGEINDAKSVELANILSENCISLELRKIELGNIL